jgi:acyl-coenzyme A thioesterase PaaI-like protein
MRFERERDMGEGRDGVVCRYPPRAADQGFPGVMHGGIINTLLDEAMAWALWAQLGALGVTAKMETRYRRPVPSDSELLVRARVTAERGRRYELEAILESAEGIALVESTALFLRLAPEEERRVVESIGWGASTPPDGESPGAAG